ncbi:chorismate mutase [Streptomyces sp. NPDC001480]|uniref:chorismate mutase n=1 Tax=Streptomyces sp. NPDC001480 TaxID=3364577 RepID=UPI00367F97B6
MTTTATTTAEQTTAAEQTTGADRTIADARERIDALDDRIIGLIQERMAVSAVVQQTRIASGGRRVHLSREMEILGRYRDALGKPGTSLAMTLLELSRGRI